MAKNAPSKEISDLLRELRKLGITERRGRGGHFSLHRDGEPLRLPNGVPMMLPSSPRATSLVNVRQRLRQCGVPL